MVLSFCRQVQFSFVAFASLILFASANLNAENLPLWELGAATGYASLPYYRGSASTRDAIVPIPISIYRGKEITAIKKKVDQRLRLTPSFAIGMIVPAGGRTGVRRNMPRLDATLEFGPKLAVGLWRAAGQRLMLNLPLRAVSSVAPNMIDMQGWVLAPYLHYMVGGTGRNSWKLNVALGPQFGSKGFHQYYYGVSNQYGLAGRAAYVAEAGYGGSRLTVYAQKSIDRLWLSAFARYDDLEGARFIDSPLIEESHSLFAGFVVGWVFAKSPKMVSE